MKILDFKTASPLFEMERDGIKPFTSRIRRVEDKRFERIAKAIDPYNISIRITNPTTGEHFTRRLIQLCMMEGPYHNGVLAPVEWVILYLGKKIK